MELDTQSILLGAILIDDRLAPYALPDLSVEHFRPELQDTFAAVQGFWEATGKLDVLQIISRYPMQKETVLACVQLCENECVRLTSDRVEEWTRAILENAAKDRFQQYAMQAVGASVSYSDLPDLYQQMGEALNLNAEKSDFKSVGELLDDYIRELDKKPQYIRTGLSKLDENLHLVPGNYFIIGGRPSAGKTALSLQIAAGMAKQGHRVCYFSLETDPATLEARLIANQLYAPLSAVKNKTLSMNELDRLAEMKRWPLFIRSAAGKNVAWMKAQALRMNAEIIFVDYLQLIHERSGGDRYSAITAISIALHELAQTTGILVVALAQLNRNAARAEPSNADLRESGQIEQDADAILLLSADGSTYFSCLSKNKEGRVGKVNLDFEKTTQRFTCIVGND